MKATLIIILTSLAAFISSCGPTLSSDGSALEAEAFDQMVKDSNNKIILDVRTPEEFAEGHIPDAVLMNVNAPDFEEKISSLDKSKTIFVYCAAGIRSEKAGSILKDSGFKKIYHLEGGLKSWTKAQKELTK